MEYPIYNCCIDSNVNSELEVSFVALVDRPAIERNFLAFKNAPLKFAINEDKRIISGPAMIADMPIYRNDKDIGEYYVLFDAATIKEIVLKFNKKGSAQNFNLMHEEGTEQTGITIFNSFLTDDSLGVCPMKGFEDVANGSWFISAQVDDDKVWQKVKDGTFKGFSVEGIFKYVKMSAQKPQLTRDQFVAQLTELLNRTTL